MAHSFPTTCTCCYLPYDSAGQELQVLADKPGGLRSLLLLEGEGEGVQSNGGPTLHAWDAFVQETLHSILDHQMVGSYTNLANLSTVSQVHSH